jgi:hypothetical protein
VQLGVQRLLAAVGFVPPLDRGRKRIECERKTLAGRVDGAGLGHPRQPLGPADTGRIRQPGSVKIFCAGKQLQREAYVACGLVVNVGAQFIAAPVNGERALCRHSLTPLARVLEPRPSNPRLAQR